LEARSADTLSVLIEIAALDGTVMVMTIVLSDRSALGG